MFLELEHVVQMLADILHGLQLVEEIEDPTQDLIRFADEVRDGDAVPVRGG